MKVTDIVKATNARLVGEAGEFHGLSTDTRTIKQGELFVALNGEHFDGHNYVSLAAEKGAAAVVVEHELDDVKCPQLVVKDCYQALGKIGHLNRLAFSGKIVGITGSSGKTTVKGMLRSICNVEGRVHATKGNLNNHIGVPLTLMGLNSEYSFGVIEAGASRIGDIKYLTDLIVPDIAVVTNAMPAHVEGFGSVAAIAHEKSEIYRHLDENGIAVINLDDQFVDVFINKISKAKIIGFCESESERAHQIAEEKDIEIITAREITSDRVAHAIFELKARGQEAHIELKLFGTHNLNNALAAAACAISLGIPIESIKKGLESYVGDKGRMQWIEGVEGAIIIDDSYNANPCSMKAAADFLSRFEDSIMVCGDMAELGELTADMHDEVGSYAQSVGVKRLFATGSMASTYVSAFGAGGKTFTTKEELIDKLKNEVKKDSVVLVKGSRSAAMEEVVRALSLGGEA